MIGFSCLASPRPERSVASTFMVHKHSSQLLPLKIYPEVLLT